MINEILQWICILAVAAVSIVPPATRVWRDFKAEDEE